MEFFMTFVKCFFCVTDLWVSCALNILIMSVFFFLRKWDFRSIVNYHEIFKVTQPVSNSGLLLAYLPMSILSLRFLSKWRCPVLWVWIWHCESFVLWSPHLYWHGLLFRVVHVGWGGQKVGNGRVLFLSMNCHCRQRKQKEICGRWIHCAVGKQRKRSWRE